ncbi:MAG: hypothetical protein MUE48_13175, partial [Desulfobacterales bacterium]|nr:hypothetical protein [Desulfobacterales bacterium]
YLGTADARLVALDGADGRVLWQTELGSSAGRSSIVAAPSVAADGGIVAAVTTELPGGGLRSTLHKIGRSGERRWSLPFPEDGFSLSAPRAFAFAANDLVLAVGAAERPQGLRYALLVVDDAGSEASLLELRDMGECPADGTAVERARRTWKMLSEPTRGSVTPAVLRPEPSPSAVPNGSVLLVAAIDPLCRAGVWEWDGRRLSTVWKLTHGGELHSSPAILGTAGSSASMPRPASRCGSTMPASRSCPPRPPRPPVSSTPFRCSTCTPWTPPPGPRRLPGPGG